MPDLPIIFQAPEGEAAAAALGPGLDLACLPAFRDPGEFIVQYCRLLWYLAPIGRAINSISLFTGFSPPHTGRLPGFIDPAVTGLGERLGPKIRVFQPGSQGPWHRALAKADMVLRWDQGGLESTAEEFSALEEKQVWRLDRFREKNEGAHFLMLGEEANPKREQDLETSRNRFQAMLQKMGSPSRAYVFGTGPSLARAMDMDFSGGLTIACNSMVQNRPLMDKLRPKLVCCADPIFHAGYSSYAGRFRQSLVEFLDSSDAFVVTVFRDYHLYRSALPKRLVERVIGIPLAHLGKVNLDLKSRFALCHSPNVLTVLLLPLACTIAEKEVMISGCDGRKPDEGYFWQHHRQSQINREMENIRRAHPAFFEIDYADYYRAHCEQLEQCLGQGESLGFDFVNLTESYIPALRKRTP